MLPTKMHQKLKDTLLSTRKSIPSIADRRMEALHCRVRVDFSALRSHLKKHKTTIDNICEQCSTNSVEDSKHYFLEYPAYDQQRSKLLETLEDNVTVADVGTLLLCGNTADKNKIVVIYQAACLYILDTERFS
ncbi:unnamed protein product [Didymodactylos carnosus]|uniref:Uncharacterized protein n=1 Tax=Didymodactylos carnosus TaxID=1234261 RepID=A0A8S2CKK8_9BILA|nr:unnamed protein product [Didymodactylos carnosus]CAF3503342.1 unnamed protein product [Didymodactylos carnosus]